MRAAARSCHEVYKDEWKDERGGNALITDLSLIDLRTHLTGPDG